MHDDMISLNIPDRKFDKFTKCMVLSNIAEIWDPLGICVGIIISARLAFQSMVRLKLEWYEICHDELIHEKWNKCLIELSKLLLRLKI